MNDFLEANERFRNPLITIGEHNSEAANTDLDSAAVCAYYPGRPEDVHRFNCTTRMYGRYVRVTMLNVTEQLNLYEIEVIGFI